ncbi:hypothetical protein Q2K19_09970 [Micromonospora soli]|uniref:hypothetical protein n=1 Tax=Micromonospora sp. NBRC 110009 TaxID=3061627 RepID=UPI0026724AF2|nr:hypothetical protein [Micromonospora sp. NBRC 110009]WKU00770.1 hypothetical protein Q2K19_09970 [Micromonospora sp. NBRC 110009]
MSVFDDGTVLGLLRLLIVVLSLFLIGVGIRTAVTRQVPPLWLRFARPGRTARTQPVRIGGGVALVGASLLLQQVPFLIQMPHALAGTLLMVALALVITAMGWLLLRRD